MLDKAKNDSIGFGTGPLLYTLLNWVLPRSRDELPIVRSLFSRVVNSSSTFFWDPMMMHHKLSEQRLTKRIAHVGRYMCS